MDIDRAHIKTRGAGAGWEDWEFIFLCRLHHNEQGSLGWNKFTQKFPHVIFILKNKGWEFVDEFGVMKLRRINLTSNE